jgi:BioD-like phosphotransacetylase family protein
MVVPGDTYTTALQVEKIHPLLRTEDEAQIAALTELVEENIDIDAIRAFL